MSPGLSLRCGVVAAFFGLGAIAAEPVYLGKIDYAGGFVQDARVTLSPSLVVKSFELRVPSFCGDVEALEAKTVTEGVADPARRQGKNAFVVNAGHGARIGAILVTLNGPATPGCAIPVYAGTGGSVDPGEPITARNYAVKRQEILRRIDKLARLASQKHDVQTLRLIQDIEYNVVYRTPPQLYPGPQADQFVQTLRVTQRTLDRIENMLNGGRQDEPEALTAE